MKIPPIQNFRSFKQGMKGCVLLKGAKPQAKNNACLSLAKTKPDETINNPLQFSSTAQYLKKYNTLPNEIKEILSPKDAVVMFKNMEEIAKGLSKGDRIGLGEQSAVYENPWLEGYHILILKNLDTINANQSIYSEKILGDSVWHDKDNTRIQIIKGD